MKNPKPSPAASLAESVNKDIGADSAGTFAASPRVVASIPTGITVLDRYVLGCGGLPIGRIVEVYSEQSAGKSSFALQCLAAAQRAGGTSVLIETEQALETERASTFGCALEDVVLIQPDHIEGVLEAIESVMKRARRKPLLVVWDSVAATPTKREIDEGLTGSVAIGERARVLSAGCRLLTGMAAERSASLLLVNQVRDAIGVMYGDKWTTPGGHAVKFAASIRLQLFSGKSVKDGADHIAKAVTFSAVKNRFAPPYRKAKVRLNFATGWDDAWSTLEHAKARGLAKDSARGAKALAEAQAALGWEATGEVPGEGFDDDADDE